MTQISQSGWLTQAHVESAGLMPALDAFVIENDAVVAGFCQVGKSTPRAHRRSVTLVPYQTQG